MYVNHHPLVDLPQVLDHSGIISVRLLDRQQGCFPGRLHRPEDPQVQQPPDVGCYALIGLKRQRVLADLDWVCSWFGFYIYREAMLSQPIPRLGPCGWNF